MLTMNRRFGQHQAAWEAAGVRTAQFDHAAMVEKTMRQPRWIHIGAGNIFRGFIAKLQQDLLEQGLAETGIVAAETFDHEIIDRIYDPFDALTLLVSLLPDGTTRRELVASVAKGLRAGPGCPEDLQELTRLFEAPELQLVSFTITEKGYALTGPTGAFLPQVEADLERGPAGCGHAMTLLTALLYRRYRAGGAPLAAVSMDNCSHNGEKLREAVLTVAIEWAARSLVPGDFLEWLGDESNVAFPWTMIDKITPRPSAAVAQALRADGIGGMDPIVTEKNTYIAPFVNAEQPQYLVVEDRFPNGRPPLERAGVFLTDRETVNRTERMKVTTCLNPLHTALAVFGCLLGYESIAAEMRDPQLRALVEEIGDREGLPVVTDPKILKPEDFLREVLEQRLPNPFLPDTPQRIATDTSQKIAIRFGETIKRYGGRAAQLRCIPLTLAGWLRYLLAVDDAGRPMACSSDPRLQELQQTLSAVRFGDPLSVSEEILVPLLRDRSLFGTDLVDAGLADGIIAMLRTMTAGPGAVRKTLVDRLKKEND